MGLNELILLEPQYRDYVWGGKRLRPDVVPTAEAWVIYENDVVSGGPHAGKTLAELASEFGEALLGSRPLSQTGTRFPLLIKLLDCADWLSLQVHPDDELARKLEGDGMFGKTEAWYFLDAKPGSEILCGLQPGSTREEMERGIREGTLLDCMQRLEIHRGDSILIPPRTIHALGPGLLLCEVQQTSDITYRVYDWDRPQTGKRPLHIEQSIEAADPSVAVKLIPPPAFDNGKQHPLVACQYFTMELLTCAKSPVRLDTKGETFHALTIIDGSAQVEGDGWKKTLLPLESAVVPANVGKYRISPMGRTKILKASVE